jgi:hypothetical protein
MSVVSMTNKDKQMSKEQIDGYKLFLYALKESDEESPKKMLEIFAKNSDGSVPREISSYAQLLLKGNDTPRPEKYRSLSQYNVADLKQLRQTLLLNVSDEAMEDFNAITELIRWTQSNGNTQERNK